MQTISIKASTSYEAHIGHGILASCGELVSRISEPCTIAVITDSTVGPLYEETVKISLTEAGFRVVTHSIPSGESSKNLFFYGEILEFLASSKLTRSDLLIALGGGVVGDITGFAAATYLRGIGFIQIPTTFLAAADSSTGGKTAVNLSCGKNLAGAFWPPRAVICDCATFDTLPKDTFADGVAETIKHSLIADKAFFELLMQGHLYSRIEDVVRRDMEIKRDFVSSDEFDRGRRQMLNFGHTIGHAVEMRSGFAITHGHAVAIGMVSAARAAYRLGYSQNDFSSSISEALQRYGLPVESPYRADELIEIAAGDKKRSGDHINVIVLSDIGRANSVSLDMTQFESFIQQGVGV